MVHWREAVDVDHANDISPRRPFESIRWRKAYLGDSLCCRDSRLGSGSAAHRRQGIAGAARTSSPSHWSSSAQW